MWLCRSRDLSHQYLARNGPSNVARAQMRKLHTTTSRARPLFFDYQSTTPVDPRVLDAMMPFLTTAYGNPHSRTHAYGWEAEDAIEDARVKVAALINARPKEIVFTSGATESNNACVKGAALFRPKKKHIITSTIEHKCVLASCRWLEENGWEVTYLPVDRQGRVDVASIEKAIRPDTALVSIMYLNNEVGVVQPIDAIAALCERENVLFHTDAAQASGRIEIDVQKSKIGLMSLSSHKVYGPKGIGAMYIRSGARSRIRPLIDGGGQERGLRSGTLSPPLCVGMGEACAIARVEMQKDRQHVKKLSNYLLEELKTKLPNIELNGGLEESLRYPGIVNISFSGVEGESLIMSVKDVAISSGSACTSATLEPSYVLRALGQDEEAAHTSLRFGIGRFTHMKEVEECAEQVVREVRRLRELSPLWEMRTTKEEGGAAMVWT